MRHAFQQYHDIHQILAQSDCGYLGALTQRIGQFDELQSLLEKAIVDAPPVLVRDGGVIALVTTANLMSGVHWPMAQRITSIA